jgi:hypothetical protein
MGSKSIVEGGQKLIEGGGHIVAFWDYQMIFIYYSLPPYTPHCLPMVLPFNNPA